MSFDFVDQDSMRDTRYYEQIIFQDKRIPTRNGSLHDYFNAFIWLQFAQTKSLLNKLHWQDISMLGHKTRTSMRDRVTHFDECGMLLISDLPELKNRLAMHDWQWLFVANENRWFKRENGIIPLHFGHANLEMLCQPFIGLTAKVLVMTSSELLQLAYQSLQSAYSLAERAVIRQQIDEKLAEYLTQASVFQNKKSLLPMPILGIPGWHNAPQDADFYNDASYFMPHPSHR